MTALVGALFGVLATLGAVALGSWFSRRNEQSQWFRDECKRVYLEFLFAATDFQKYLSAFATGARNDPTFWQSTSLGTPAVAWSLGNMSSQKSRLDRARDETLVFGDAGVDAVQMSLYMTLMEGFRAASSDERTAKQGLAVIERCLDQLEPDISEYTQAVRTSLGR